MQNILVPVDFSAVTEVVLAHVVPLAKAFKSTLWLLHVAAPEPDFVGYEPGPASVREGVERAKRDEQKRVEAMAADLHAEGVDAKALMLEGEIVPMILGQAEEWAVDLIAIGSHGHGAIHKVLLGSVSEGVLRNATCAVLIVPAPERAARSRSSSQ